MAVQCPVARRATFAMSRFVELDESTQHPDHVLLSVTEPGSHASMYLDRFEAARVAAWLLEWANGAVEEGEMEGLRVG